MKSISTFVFLSASLGSATGSDWKHLLPVSVQHVLDISLAQTKATPEVVVAIDTILGTLGDMVKSIESAHNDTDLSIADAVKMVSDAASVELDDRSAATKADGVWVQCKKDEQSLRLDYDNKVTDYDNKKEIETKDCTYETMTGGQISAVGYECSFKDMEERCISKFQASNASVQKDMAALLAKINKDVAIYDANVAACKKATQDALAAMQARDKALSVWNQKRSLCLKANQALNKAACTLQRASENKCAKVGEYQKLIDETKVVNGTGNSDVDRRAEFAAITAAECALEAVKTGTETTACAVEKDFDRAIGTLNLQTAVVEGYQSIEKSYWACSNPQPVRLSGKTWTVSLPVQSASDYREIPKTWDMTQACTAAAKPVAPVLSCIRNEAAEAAMTGSKVNQNYMLANGWRMTGGQIQPSGYPFAGLRGMSFAFLCMGPCSLEYTLQVATMMKVEAREIPGPPTMGVWSLAVGKNAMDVPQGGAPLAGEYPFQKGDVFKLSFSGQQGIKRVTVKFGFAPCPSSWAVAN